MPESRWFRVGVGVYLGTLLAVAAWFRITSLGFAPEPQGDEAYWGVQAMRLLHGGPVANGSPTGNPINLFFVGPAALWMACGGPSYQALRGVAAVSGLLAVGLTYVLGRRTLGSRAALIATGLLAVLPILIIYARIGWEPCQIPLVGVLGLAFAFRRSGLGLVLAVVAGLFIHPTTMLAVPIFLVVYLTRTAQEQWDAGRPEGTLLAWWRRGWRPLATVLTTLAIVGPLMLVKHAHPTTFWTARQYGLGPRDWSLFLDGLMKMVLGLCMGGPTEISPAGRQCFWTLVAGVGVVGSVRLARARRWDALALVVALLVMTAALHQKFGHPITHPGLSRYLLFLVVPAAWAAACLIDALFPTTLERRWAPVGSGVLAVSLLGLATLLLANFKRDWFDFYNDQAGGHESLWTLRTEVPEASMRIARALHRDLTGPGGAPAPVPILTDDWWLYRPLQFAFVTRPELKVASLEYLAPEVRLPFVIQQLERGGFLVGHAGGPAEQVARVLPDPDRIQTEHVHGTMQRLHLIYRRRREGEPPRPPCDCARAQIAVYERPEPAPYPTDARR